MSNTYIGDTWEFEYHITDVNGKSIDLQSYEVKAGIKDTSGRLIIKKNSLAGGNDSEIKVLDNKGNILIIFTKEETEQFTAGDFLFEIEITSNLGKRYTVVRQSFTAIDDII